jgi:hypothetical protein
MQMAEVHNMPQLPPETPGDKRHQVKKLDLFAGEIDALHDGPFPCEAMDTIRRRIDLGTLRRPFWDRWRLFMVLTFLCFCLAGGGLVLRKIYFPQPGRIYHHSHRLSTAWTEEDFEMVFGSPGKLVRGFPGSPNGHAMEWKGDGQYCLIHFNSNGRVVAMTGRTWPPSIFEKCAAFFGLPEP